MIYKEIIATRKFHLLTKCQQAAPALLFPKQLKLLIIISFPRNFLAFLNSFFFFFCQNLGHSESRNTDGKCTVNTTHQLLGKGKIYSLSSSIYGPDQMKKQRTFQIIIYSKVTTIHFSDASSLS